MAKKSILGIDIGYDQLKLALVNNGEVVVTAMAQMPENLLKEGRFTSPEVMASLIRETMEKNGIKATQAAVVLPNELVYVKNVDMPMMTEEQLQYNLPFEFHDYITDEVGDYIFDYAVIEGSEEADQGAPLPAGDPGGEFAAESEGGSEQQEASLHLMAVGVEANVIEELKAMLRKAGLKLVKTAPALSSYISLIRDMRTRPGNIVDEYAILDLGYHGITMYMFKKDQHIATREFEMGLSTLDDMIAEKFGIERHLAHTYVLSNYENCLNSDECVMFYDNFSVELMRAINFYEFSNQNSELNDLWLCGGGAVNEPLLRMINDSVELRLHSSNELLPEGTNISQYNSFVQAIGVTLEI